MRSNWALQLPSPCSRIPVDGRAELPCCTKAKERELRLVPALDQSIITPSGIPSPVITFRIRHPILASTLCDDSRLARIAEPTIAL